MRLQAESSRPITDTITSWGVTVLLIPQRLGAAQKARFLLAAGDWVTLETRGEEGMIETILPRRNLLQRPLVCKPGLAFAVFAAKDPAPSFLLIDKLLALAEAYDIPAALVINKCDLAAEGFLEQIRAIYEPLGYPVYFVEARKGKGLDPIRAKMTGLTSAFGGPSGAGKSTLLNHLDPSLTLETGAVSEKIGRGRHTTRFAQLLPVAGGFIVDTPGFGNIDLRELELPSVEAGFRELAPLCRAVPLYGLHSHP